MRVLVTCIFSILILSSCNNSSKKETMQETANGFKFEKIEEILSAKTRILYLQRDSIGGNEFASIVIMDVQSKTNLQIVDNTYYNASPIWSPDGEEVLFASARIGDMMRLRLSAHHAWEQIYIFSLKEKLLFEYFNGGQDDIVNFNGLSMNSKSREIYFANSDKKIYCLSRLYNKLRVILEKLEFNYIYNMSISSDNNFLAIAFDKGGPADHKAGLIIYDLNKHEIIHQLEDNKYIALYGWSYDNIPYFEVGSENLMIDLKTGLVKPFFLKIDRNKFRVDQIFAESEKVLIMLIGIKATNPKTNTYHISANEIVKYNVETEKMEWITRDGLLKSNLDVYFKEKDDSLK